MQNIFSLVSIVLYQKYSSLIIWVLIHLGILQRHTDTNNFNTAASVLVRTLSSVGTEDEVVH